MIIRIDFEDQSCQWEPEDCPNPGAGMAGEWFGVYCAEHLKIWRREIERQEERDREELPTRQQVMREWFQRLARPRDTP